MVIGLQIPSLPECLLGGSEIGYGYPGIPVNRSRSYHFPLKSIRINFHLNFIKLGLADRNICSLLLSADLIGGLKISKREDLVHFPHESGVFIENQGFRYLNWKLVTLNGTIHDFCGSNSKQFLLCWPCNITRSWLKFHLAAREVTLHHAWNASIRRERLHVLPEPLYLTPPSTNIHYLIDGFWSGFTITALSWYEPTSFIFLTYMYI